MIDLFDAAAAGYSGPGMLEKMRETVSRYVHESKDTMFAEAKNVMMNHLLSLKVCPYFNIETVSMLHIQNKI